MRLLSFFILLMGVVLTSCQRSNQYRRDDDSAQNEGTAWGESASAGKDPLPSISLAQKLEMSAQPKKRVLVLNFWDETPLRSSSSADFSDENSNERGESSRESAKEDLRANEFGIFSADELRRGLRLSQKVILTTDIKRELNTADFLEGEHVKVAQLIREGRRLGLSVLVIGRVAKITFRQKGDDVGLFRQRQSKAVADVEIKVFDVQGGRELIASSQSGEATVSALTAFEGSSVESGSYRSELIHYALKQAVAKFVPEVVHSVEKLTWQGQIAKLIGAKAYINAGRASGLIAGDILKVLNPGEEIYDPQTGALLGRSQGVLKGTLEVVDFIGTDAAVAEVHTGANFREGDFVQLY